MLYQEEALRQTHNSTKKQHTSAGLRTTGYKRDEQERVARLWEVWACLLDGWMDGIKPR